MSGIAEETYKGRRVLVTGSDGFIGRHLSAALDVAGAEVFASQADIANPESIDLELSAVEPQVVFNLAASLRKDDCAEAFLSQAAVTMAGAINLAGACLRRKIAHLVQVGSSEEYGHNPAPFEETQAAAPISPYSVAKAAATRFIVSAGKVSGATTALVARPTVVYGPGQTGTMLIPSLLSHYTQGRTPSLSSGEQSRDFLYVADAVEGLLLLGLRRDLTGNIFNLGCGKPTLVKDVAALAASAANFKGDLGFNRIPQRANDVMVHYANVAKAKRLLGWQAKTSLSEGLQNTAQWWRQQSPQPS